MNPRSVSSLTVALAVAGAAHAGDPGSRASFALFYPVELAAVWNFR
jgi:hypothetical protein